MKRARPSSSACRSISAATGAAWTWGRRRFGSPASASGSRALGLHGRRQRRPAAPIPGDADARDERQEIHPRHRATSAEQLYDERARVARRRRACRSCSAAITASPRARSPRPRRGRATRAGLPIGLLWIDAHGDMNTPATSPSGNVHGMPLAALLGPEPSELARHRRLLAKVCPAHTVLIGVRNLDEREKVARPRFARARLHDEGHRSPGHRVGRRTGGEPGGRRHGRHPRVVRHGRLRSARSRRASARRSRADSTTAKRTW